MTETRLTFVEGFLPDHASVMMNLKKKMRRVDTTLARIGIPRLIARVQFTFLLSLSTERMPVHTQLLQIAVIHTVIF